MSDDYIKREDAVKAVSKVDDYGDGVGFEVRSHCLVELETLPPADVREVVHGENIGTDYAECDQFICSECEIHLQGWVRIDDDDYDDGIVHEYEFRFCPNCGARMFAKDTNVPNKEGADYE